MSETSKNNDESKSDVEKVAKGSGISLLGGVVGKSLFFIIQIVIVRLFGSEFFGLYILGLAVARLIEILSRFGLDFGSIRFVSIYYKIDNARTKGTIISTLVLSFLGSIVLVAILYSCAGFIANTFFHKPELKEVFRIFVFCIPLMSVSFVATSATQGFHTTKYVVWIREIFQPSVNLLLIFLFSFTNFGLTGLVYAFAISYFLTLILSIYLLTRLYLSTIVEQTKAIFEIKKLVTYSAPLMFAGFINVLLAWTDIIILGYFVSSREVSIYRTASLAPFLLMFVLNSYMSIYAPVIADLYQKGELGRVERLLKLTTKWIFYITLPAMIIMIFFADTLMNLFGPEFVKDGAIILVTLALSNFINCLSGGLAYTLVMTGKQKIEFINSLVLITFNIILNLFLIPIYGILGAALAKGITILVIKLLRLLEVYYIYRIQPYNKNFFSGFAAALASVVILTLLNRITILSSYQHFALGIISTVGSFLVFFYFSTKTEDDKHIIQILKIKLSSLIIKRRA
ncbi:flippase [Candidatus Scalindua japonica]|uniref:flippase n=1 Tax=Candidatus Scalindua japonica TaxID=1284222 RepID=UPI000BDE7B89|nr:flippase [Candidatus Scalindua japonica]